MANDDIYPHLECHRLSPYLAGNLNHRDNPSLKTPGYQAVRNEICSSIPATTPAHRSAHLVLSAPAHRPVQDWLLPSPKHLQGWRSPSLSENLFHYFITLMATVFSLHLIWIYQVPACGCCLSSFCSSLGRAGLCLPTVKCNCEKKNMGLTPTSNCRNNKHCTFKLIRIREACDTSSRITSYHCKTDSSELIYHPWLSHKQVETQRISMGTLLVLSIYSNSQILECGWFWIGFQHSQVTPFFFFPNRNTLAHGICYLGQWPHTYPVVKENQKSQLTHEIGNNWER